MDAANMALLLQHGLIVSRAIGGIRPNIPVAIGMKNVLQLAPIMGIGLCGLGLTDKAKDTVYISTHAQGMVIAGAQLLRSSNEFCHTGRTG